MESDELLGDKLIYGSAQYQSSKSVLDDSDNLLTVTEIKRRKPYSRLVREKDFLN